MMNKKVLASLIFISLVTGCGGSSKKGTEGTEGRSPTTEIIVDKVVEQVVHQGKILKYSIKTTAYHQNDSSLPYYNLWDYSFSNSKDSYEIFFDAYYKATTNSQESYSPNATKLVYELDPRTANPTRDKRKITMIHNQGSLASIEYDSVVSRTYKDINATPLELTAIELKQEKEDLFFNQDPCSSTVISKGDIFTSYIDKGFWQIGDKITHEIVFLSHPVFKCENGTVQFIGMFNNSTEITSTSTLNNYNSTLVFRDKSFDSVLEFTSNGLTTVGIGGEPLYNLSLGEIIQSGRTIRHFQLNTGGVAQSNRLCTFAPITDDGCSLTDGVAINIPQIPEI